MFGFVVLLSVSKRVPTKPYVPGSAPLLYKGEPKFQKIGIDSVLESFKVAMVLVGNPIEILAVPSGTFMSLKLGIEETESAVEVAVVVACWADARNGTLKNPPKARIKTTKLKTKKLFFIPIETPRKAILFHFL